MAYAGSMKLPANSNMQPPETVDIHEDFADYHSSYTVSNNSLHFERRLITKSSEVPVPQIEAYRQFVKAIIDDNGTFISLDGGDVRSAQFTKDPVARLLYDQASKAWQERDIPAAAEAMRKAVEADPGFAQAWLWLGTAHMSMGNPDLAVTEIKKAIALDPKQLSTYPMLATTLLSLHREDEAIQVWKDLEKQSPGNLQASRSIASILVKQKRYSEALPELEAALKNNPEDPNLLLQLGDTYFHTGNKEKGISCIEDAVDKSPNEMIWNDAAYTLAENNVQLDDALNYSQEAVGDAEDNTADIDLNDLSLGDIQMVSKLAAAWDTLGWVHFRLGHLDLARKVS